MQRRFADRVSKKFEQACDSLLDDEQPEATKTAEQVRLRKRQVEYELTRLGASGDYSSTVAATGRQDGGGFAISVKSFGGSLAPHY